MAEEQAQGCVSPAGGPIAAKSEQPPATRADSATTEQTMHVTVGMKAPDFEAGAYHEGGFKNVKLSDFLGKWVFLCFYPGDFTFV